MALIESGTILEAAEKCGISERTLRVWIKEPDFAAAYAAARRQLIDNALLSLQRASNSAAFVLIKSLKAEDANIAIRASLGILDRAVKLTELCELVERIEALEQLAQSGMRITSSLSLMMNRSPMIRHAARSVVTRTPARSSRSSSPPVRKPQSRRPRPKMVAHCLRDGCVTTGAGSLPRERDTRHEHPQPT